MAGITERRIMIMLFTTEDQRVEEMGLTPELLHLQDYLQKPTLAEGLVAAGIKRAVDVGTAKNFEAVKNLALLRFQDQNAFTPEDVWAVDPAIYPDRMLRDRLPKYGHLFRRLPLSAQDLQARVASGEVAPFDLVLSKGVISTGWNHDGEMEEEYTRRLEIARALRGCLNPQNPNSVLVLSGIEQDEMLPISDRDLDQLGLDLVYSSKAPEEDTSWAHSFQVFGLFPPRPYNNFYNLVICKSRT